MTTSKDSSDCVYGGFVSGGWWGGVGGRVGGGDVGVRAWERGRVGGANGGKGGTGVVVDEVSANEGDLVGRVEGREAAVPFWPQRVPYDAYNGCILDTLDFDPVLETT